MAAERRAVLEDGRPQNRRGNADAREDEGKRKLVRGQARALAPQPGGQGRGDPEVREGNREERHRVEENRLALCTHWALGMIGAANLAVEALMK